MRIGMGYDVHQLAEGYALILGGVTIPWEKGLVGHSDADVLTHTIMDALLGAAGLGDIGRHFPDTDPVYKGADSVKLLEEVYNKITAAGYRVGNIDGVICAQAPRLAPHLAEMTRCLATALCCEENKINIKATTTEHLGFVGNGQGMSAYAVALIEEI